MNIKIYQDRNNNFYVQAGEYKVRITDGTRHDGTTVGEFSLVREIEISDIEFYIAKMDLNDHYEKQLADMTAFIAMMTDAQKALMELVDYSKISNIEFDGIDHSDAPDYCDAYIVSAELHGTQLTEMEIDRLNEDRDLVYEKLMEYLH